MDPRLSMIAKLIGRCECYADIGCDHGRLGAYLLQSGQCARAVLTDISEPSLHKAKILIDRTGLSDRVEFVVGDGALVFPRPVEVTVIARMGGTTIARIIREGRKKLEGTRLILQPNVAVPELRAALSECGYAITDERVVQDGRRCYVLLCARQGESDYSLKEKIVGPVLIRRMPPELLPYAEFRLRVVRKAMKEASSGQKQEITNKTEPLKAEIKIWEEVCECLRQ